METIKEQISEIGLKSMLKRHEGFSATPYRCSAGKWTIGHGHSMQHGGMVISRHVADVMLDEDIHLAIFQYESLGLRLEQARQNVCVNMIFNLGLHGFLGFKKMIAALEQGNYETAADEMIDSLWAEQVKGRAVELAEIMRHG